MIRFVSLTLALLVVWSCIGNSFFIDYDRQVIIPSKCLIQTGIKCLDIQTDSSYCHIVLSESVPELDPFCLPDNCVYIGDRSATVFQKGKKYCITNETVGDAGPFSLEVLIDSSGLMKPLSK